MNSYEIRPEGWDMDIYIKSNENIEAYFERIFGCKPIKKQIVYTEPRKTMDYLGDFFYEHINTNYYKQLTIDLNKYISINENMSFEEALELGFYSFQYIIFKKGIMLIHSKNENIISLYFAAKREVEAVNILSIAYLMK